VLPGNIGKMDHCYGTSYAEIELNLIACRLPGGNLKYLCHDGKDCLPGRVHSAIHTGMRNLSGQAAIPFSLADSDGRVHSLEEYRGSWLLMVFHRHLG
jgi:hypothetical protein